MRPKWGPARPPLRVLQIGMNWFQSGSGGLERGYRDLLRALPHVGVEPTGLVLGPPDAETLTDGQVVAFGRDGATMPERLWRARQRTGVLLRSGRFGAVAAHFAMFAAPALDRMRGTPLVVHFHGPWAGESAAEGAGRLPVLAKRAVERAVYRRADRVIVLSRAFGNIVRDTYGVPEAKLRLVPGTLDMARYIEVGETVGRVEARERLGWPQDRRILLSVRRLTGRMGLDRLIAAMADVARAEPDALLMIGGGGHMGEVLRAQVQSLGLERHVRFLGFVPDDDLPLAYRAAEMNVVPSVVLEGFGLTTVEALAAGTPSLVTPVGGLPEVVSALSPDLVFESPAPGDIAERLVAALRGTVRLPGEVACRDYASSRYDPLLSASCIAAVYREVAQQ